MKDVARMAGVSTSTVSHVINNDRFVSEAIREKVDAAFFADNGWKSNLLVNIGYGDPGKLYGRLPRLSFDEACLLA